MRFIDNQDGTVTDNQTNLLWQKSDDGIMKCWNKAGGLSKNLSPFGFKNWRLPSIRELISIIDYEKRAPSIDDLFICNPNFYWSGSDVIDYDGSFWVVNFYSGHVKFFKRNFEAYVRYVHTIGDE